MTHKASLYGNRDFAHRLVDAAPSGSVMTIAPPKRTVPQNDKMYTMLTKLAAAKPEGRSLPVHKWKSLVMDLAGCKPDWERSLDGESMVCVGYKSSRLSKAQMSDVIEAIYAYAAQNDVELD
jgi:hypothetical protein